ncbi:UPF0158 family protein [Roseateles sp.]|uniref:UPF0158 family protein n=1 Tax=Roseateles sp. TaxID=1971397 RepID=UPI0026014ADB|nr:UPF0158 family protein [Roseateles sp.]MBV8035383.1 hypothetical protein [Roseateles sp.]
MNPSVSLPDRDDFAARRLTIDLDELIWALNSHDALGEYSHWLNLESGELLYHCGFDAEDEADESPRDSGQWLRVEPVESSQAFEIMDDFTRRCRDARLAQALARTLQQRKPFRRFKDTLAAFPEQRDAWFAFEREAMEVIARRWCEDHGISPRWSSQQRTPPG